MNSVYTEDGFKFWANKAPRGQSVVYYTGFLMYDRERLLQRGVSPEHFPDEIRTAKMAWNHYTYGDVALVQKKKGPFLYDYIAVKI